jgi:hypothetical protein
VGGFLDEVGSTDQGSAYIFQRDQGGANTWGQVTQIFATGGAASALFGYSVAISDDHAIVGARSDDVGGNVDQGSAYIFQRDQGGANTWGQVKQVTAGDPAAGDLFGQAVAISGDYLIVGAFANDIGGNHDQGSAYIDLVVKTGSAGAPHGMTAAMSSASPWRFRATMLSGGAFNDNRV